MKQAKGSGLKVAFIYDPKSHYLDLGHSDHECADLADSVTIDGVSSALENLGHSVVHVPGIKALVNHLANGDQSSWDMVFNYSEGVYGSARESQVPALLEAYQVPFTFSDAATLAVCIDKGRTKMLLSHYRIATSPFELIPSLGPTVNYSALAKQLSYPVFAKPIAASTSNGITPSNKISRPEDLEEVAETLRSQFSDQEILLENFLDGREFTVAILGTGDSAKVLGALEVTWYNPEGTNDKNPSVDFATSSSKAGRGPGHDMGHVHADMEDPLVKKVAGVALSAYRALGCRDGGRVDIRLSSEKQASVPNVVEVNPLFGLRPDYSLFTCIAKNNGMEYHEVIAEILASAFQRQS